LLANGYIRGQNATYETSERLGSGQSGETFLARVVEVNSPEAGLTVDQHVVIKIPRLPKGPLEDVFEALGDLHRLTNAELVNFQRLRGLDCVAEVLDQGIWQVNLDEGGSEKATVIFIVQQLITGAGLDDYLKASHPDNFSGLSSTDQFFSWARQLATALGAIHRRQVVHGDIWPANIRVTESGKPVFIDFGQAVFRDLVFDISQIPGRNRAYMAPEGSRSVSGDIYSIGGVLLFLATGQDPFPPIEDIDELKERVARLILDHNPKLYRDNSGIVDVIARCLRFSKHGRIPHTEALLRDVATFDRGTEVGGFFDQDPMLDDIRSSVQKLQSIGNPFFLFAATLQLRRIANLLGDMSQGSWDLIGDHEAIVGALAQYTAGLRAGDQYHTISTATYWLPQNLGVNGRFLSMNRLAAQAGAVIRRVFLVTQDELETDRSLRRILKAHLREMDELEQTGVTTARAEIEGGGYFTGVWIVSEREREKRLRRGEHYGLVIRNNHRVIMHPIYREDRQMVAVQFRSGAATEGRLEQVRLALTQARPLAEFRELLNDAV